MPDQSGQDRTEKPTQQRLKKARQEGQVPQSQEVPSVLVLATAIGALAVLMPSFLQWISHTVVEAITYGAAAPSDGERFCEFFRAKGGQVLGQFAPYMALIGVMSCFSSAIVSGLVFSPKALKIDWQRVNPVKGIKNVISLKALMRLGFGLLKLSLISLICYLYFRRHWNTFLSLRYCSPGEAMTTIGSLILFLLLRVLVAMAVIAGLDFAYQKWSFLRQMRMTKQEVKEEHKQHEGNPEVRGKLRQMQREMVQRRMMQDVPKADVVITNPTHYAVALQYDQHTMSAPLVLAKGSDHLALKIRQIAKEHHVPVVERPSLARALYAACDIQQSIPSELFVAVAEVLAMIWKLRHKRKRPKQGKTS